MSRKPICKKGSGTVSARLGLDLIETGIPPRDRPSAERCEEQGKQVDVIKRHRRLAGLVVVAKPDRDRNLGVNTLKAAGRYRASVSPLPGTVRSRRPVRRRWHCL